ncbi:MAG: HEAT repeat domain-containing protein [Candidatus Puniceispirillaceae bacterium]
MPKLGQFISGHSGNVGGRPKDEYKVAELARSYTTEALDTLVVLMRTAKDERVRGTAAQALLDRGWGKPKVEIVTEEKQDYIAALQAVNERLQVSKHGE